MSEIPEGFGRLRQIIETARAEARCSLNALTVLAKHNDPYRLDTEGGREAARWVAEQIDERFRPHQRPHLRAVHYALVAVGDLRRPDGKIYSNTDLNYDWLGWAVKAARWLGVIAFERITDERNDPPTIYRSRGRTLRGIPGLEASVFWSGDWSLDVSCHLCRPSPSLTGFSAEQPYALAIFGEKSSLADVVDPIAQRCNADLYLGAGEISETLAYQMALDAARDGRPLIVFTIADFDPSGHQMPVSVARKLQAQRDLFFPDLEFKIVPLALKAEQVREFNLPSTPLKDSERRGDKWRAEHGLEQTEIDALATLRPDVLRQIVEEGITPYFDATLEDRVRAAKSDWEDRAQEVIDAQVDEDEIAEIEATVEGLEAQAREQMEAIRSEFSAKIAAEDDRLQQLVANIDLPPAPDLPEAELFERSPQAVLVSSDQSWIEQTRALKVWKSYGNGDAKEDE
jgi:hypothetical protein